MPKRGISGWVVALVIGLASVLGMAQQDEGPVLKPNKPAMRPTSATLLVMCDLACNWKLGGDTKGPAMQRETCSRFRNGALTGNWPK